MVQTQPSRIHVLAKPTGAICNLNCSYCFFLDKEQLYFHHVNEPLKVMASLMEQGRPATDIMTWFANKERSGQTSIFPAKAGRKKKKTGLSAIKALRKK